MDKLFISMQLVFNICFLSALLAIAWGGTGERAPRRSGRRGFGLRRAKPPRESARTVHPAAPGAEELDTLVASAEVREERMNVHGPAAAAPPSPAGGPSAPAIAELQARIARFRRTRGTGDGPPRGGPEVPSGPATLARQAGPVSRVNPPGSHGTRLARLTGQDGR